jgi:dihydrofolate reductase
MSASERRVVVSSFITMDGYMVGPNEDISWVSEGFDPRMQSDIAEYMGERSDCFVFGRITYEMFAAYWPTAVPYEAGDALRPSEGREDPRIIRALNDSLKLVASTTLQQPTWKNTRVIRDGLVETIAALKREPGKSINVQGSASVVQALERADLVDEYHLYVHPVLLGAGKLLFAAGAGPQDFRRIDLKSYDNGVVRMVFRRDRAR